MCSAVVIRIAGSNHASSREGVGRTLGRGVQFRPATVDIGVKICAGSRLVAVVTRLVHGIGRDNNLAVAIKGLDLGVLCNLIELRDDHQRKDTDDGDHDHQFDKCKALALSYLRKSIHSKTLPFISSCTRWKLCLRGIYVIRGFHHTPYNRLKQGSLITETRTSRRSPRTWARTVR